EQSAATSEHEHYNAREHEQEEPPETHAGDVMSGEEAHQEHDGDDDDHDHGPGHQSGKSRHRLQGAAQHANGAAIAVPRPFSITGADGCRSTAPAADTPLRAVAIQEPHSITSSTRERNAGGMAMPSALAVCRLRTSSSLVAWITGRLAGFSPFRTRPT